MRPAVGTARQSRRPAWSSTAASRHRLEEAVARHDTCLFVYAAAPAPTGQPALHPWSVEFLGKNGLQLEGLE
jgi:hypothetical protein